MCSMMKPKTILEVPQLDVLFQTLRGQGYILIGPTIRDGAIVYDRLEDMRDLPKGWTDEQDAGVYRLRKRSDEAYFGFNVGPHAWKRFLHPPVSKLWEASRRGNSFQVQCEKKETPHYAFLGVRACELHAMLIEDKVFLRGDFVDPEYKRRRENQFTVAVNCGQAGGTCFCVSMDAGPKATTGFDLALTEILEKGRHYFVLESGSEQGQALLEKMDLRLASIQEVQASEGVSMKAASQMGRRLDVVDIKELLYRNYDHPRWEEVAKRCLACANCTMACPTCFCTTVEDVTDLTGDHAERWRKWDSCFTMDFSHIHGGTIRSSTKSKYRQWMTHKLAAWKDQFDSSGCVGCGRCITWCPVGIDITEEMRTIRATENKETDND